MNSPRLFAEMPPARLAKINLLISDIDDTITLAGKITSQVLDAFVRLQAAGVAVVLATGRSSGWGQGLAAYVDGVACVVAENGLTAFDSRGARMAIQPPPLVDFDRGQLCSVASDLARKHNWEPTNDAPFRLYEETFVRPAAFDADTQQRIAAGLPREYELQASSIHLHIKPACWNKADGVAAVRAALLAGSSADDATDLLVVGDSGNDRPLFRAWREQSVGVANVMKFAAELGDDMPAWITQGAEAAGWLEVASAVLAANA